MHLVVSYYKPFSKQLREQMRLTLWFSSLFSYQLDSKAYNIMLIVRGADFRALDQMALQVAKIRTDQFVANHNVEQNFGSGPASLLWKQVHILSVQIVKRFVDYTA